MSPVFRETNPLHQLPSGVRSLLIANVVVFLLQIVLPNATLEQHFALHSLQSGLFRPWQLITYAFFHANGFHLFINMWILWMFGNPLEAALGTRRLLVFFLVCCVGAAVSHIVLVPQGSAIGASGGIYGLLAAFAIIYPDSVMYLFFVLPMKSVHAVWFIGLLALASAMQSGGSRIAHFAHLGGLLTGYLYFKLPVWYMNLRSIRARRPKFHVIRPDSQKHFEEVDRLQSEVDRILEKISHKGIDSLTEDEHETMRAYAKRKK